MRRAGEGRGGGSGRRRRSGAMRARADEMAALLDEAAPRAARIRKRRATAVPAAVAAFGALSIGGVGLALGLTPTGAEGVLPADPSPALADPASPAPTGTPDAARDGIGPEGPVADPAVAGADLIRTDDRDLPAEGAAAGPSTGAGSHPAPSTPGRSRAPRPTSTRPSPTSTRPRATSSRPAPSATRSATPRSASTHPATTRSPVTTPRPVAQRSTLAPASGSATSRTAPASTPGSTRTSG